MTWLRCLLLMSALGCILGGAAYPAATEAADSSAIQRQITATTGAFFRPIPAETTYVVAPRPDRIPDLKRVSSFAARIEVDQARGAGARMPDLLARQVGVVVQRYGGPGSPASLSIRGANPGEIEIFLDRVPLRSAAQGFVNLNAIDLAQIEAIEVYRSAPPTDLGGEISGAAVRLITRPGGGGRITLGSSAGSYGTSSHEVSASGNLGGLRYLLGGARFRTAGDFVYFNDNATTEEAGDDTWQRWSNGDVLRESFFGRVTHPLWRGTSFDLASQYWYASNGIVGTSHRPTQKSRLSTRGTLHRAEMDTRVRLGSPLHASIFGFWGSEDLLYRDPLRELAVPGAAARSVDQEHQRRGAGVRLRWTLWPEALPALGLHRLELVAETRREMLTRWPAPGSPAEDHRERVAGVLTIGDASELWDGRLHLDAYYRWDRARDNYTGANPYQPFAARPEHHCDYRGPRLGLRWIVGRGHTLKANYAHQARFPTFSELFGYAGTIRSNPRLVPEKGRRRDLGWIWEIPGKPGGLSARIEDVFYINDLEEMIVLVRVSERETKPFNLGSAHLHGNEFSLVIEHLPLLRDLLFLAPLERAARRLFGRVPADTPGGRQPAAAALALHLDWQHTRDEGRSPVYYGKQLTYHPTLRGGGNLTLRQAGWALTYGASYRAAAYWARSNLSAYRSPAQWSHGLQLRWRPAARALTLSLRIENLLDAQQQDLRGYALPGRTWYGGIELDLVRTPTAHKETRS